ncbi:E3 ubiquitin-protein ligase SNT2 [Pleurostoma richardsiae]|uniref:E3 ubiquitin-protein ligase SNT2 n=1 Tax=Pleurostoma richardsiae TaxID=41990 RepID=A0AA38RTI5_9PEZI|nr:E3 ubiquitin-protein ligase SNT2 [Pleurostoma richardsiae]
MVTKLQQNVSSSDRLSSTPASSSKDGLDAATSSKQKSRTNSPSSFSTTLPKMSDPSPPASGNGSSASQAVTKSGSNPPTKDAAASTASPYGTRSRNRTGTSRPNYAEDKDMDMDLFDSYPEKKEDDLKRSSRQAHPSSHASEDAPRQSNASSRKQPAADDAKRSASHNGTKEHHASSTAASTPTAQSVTSSHTTKKRKAASRASPVNGQSQGGSATPSSSLQGALRRSGANSLGSGGYRETNLMTFENSGARTKNNKMFADDGTVLEVNDHVYLVCEPPGEPYYLGRIMEFLHIKNDPLQPVDALRINWYYRPKDIGRKTQDTRMVFATMHSDISPLTALRGQCQIRHKSEIENMDEYRKTPDCFWYEKLYDRYIQKNYEIIPTSQIINVPEQVKKVLDERWRFILVEQGRGKELTSAVKLCKRCSGYCASNDSVDCAVCGNTYHMNCVRPPLLKKPSRGFAWSCAACSRAQERKLEARNTPNFEANEEEEFLDEEDDEVLGVDTNRTSPDEGLEAHPPATAEQIYHASLWPYRYLGIHCKVEDALDIDDRIYPRASSRLGPRHQATVLPWPGRPVQYVKPLEIVKKNGKKNAQLSKEAQAALEAEKAKREKRPKWIQDEPNGYVRRGEDPDDGNSNSTSTLLWKPAEMAGADITNDEIDEYMNVARSMSKQLGLPLHSTNLEDIARDLLFKHNYDREKALEELPKVDKAAFKEPQLTPAEVKKFEEGVAKYGSELHSVYKHVKTVAHKDIVRFYYTWKKTDRGKQVWGNYSGRKGKKEAKKAEVTASKLADDVADDRDDSAFDSEKAVEKKKGFICKFCNTKSSRQWRRAPNALTTVTESSGKNAKDKGNQYIVALCRRCAELWRRYAIQWEDIDEVAKKVAQAGGRAWKRRIDEELLKELMSANEMMNQTVYSSPEPSTTTSARAATPAQQLGPEPPRKKLKGLPDRDSEQNASDRGSTPGNTIAKKKEKAVEKPAPPPVPEIPKPRTMPCAICHQLEPLGDQHLSCRECRLTVHRNCYGVIDNRNPGKWICDMCSNDKNPQISIHYKCVLCPVESTEHDFVEPPKFTHKKRSEKEREKERIEREVAQKAADYYRKRQEEMNRPVNPREPLKRTADNNWVHVTCAVWTPEVKFGNAKALEPSEGIPSIPRARYGEVCKACKQKGGACVACHQCRAPVHIECAHQNGYLLGFDITPVKGSRRDQHNIVTINGESGVMTAAIWCKDHVPQKTIVHRMHDAVDESGTNALQLYVQNFKQADLALTGCARKANLISLTTKMSSPVPAVPVNRRTSTTTIAGIASAAAQVNGDHADELPLALQPGGKVCLTCGVDVSPKWYPIDKEQERELTNGHYGALGVEAQKFVAQRNFQCHKCKKTKRQPRPHPQPREPSPHVEPARPVAPIAAPVTSPAPPISELRNIAPYPWAVPPGQGSHRPTGPETAGIPQGPGPAPGSIMPPVQAPPVQPPIAPPSLPPTMPPRTAPSPTHPYGAPSGPYNDWHRPSSQHGQHMPPVHPHMNGAPPPMPSNNMPQLAPPNHLRPPPLSGIGPPPPPPPPPLQNGHLGQSMVNGMPPSPRRMSGPPPPLPSGGPYMHAYHQSAHHSPIHLTNGGPPPRASDHGFSHVLNPQRSPFAAPHGSPPLMRDSITLAREASNAPPRAPESRPASGASASPSLRNLLS